MIKHTLTKKQQLVLCAMYVESLANSIQAFPSLINDRKGQICISTANYSNIYCSYYAMYYLQNYALVGQSHGGQAWALTPDGEKLAKALFKVLS